MCAPAVMLAIVLSAITSGPEKKPVAVKAEKALLRGKVMTLPRALDTLGVDVRIDTDAMKGQVVLLGDDQSITPLMLDEASRAFFLDERLRGRRAEIHGVRYAGVPYLQVATFRVEWDGQMETPEYFCTVCSISLGFPQTCPCCQGSMELRKKPDRR